MRLLAEFIMRGRVQAMWMAVLGSWIPYLSQTSLALVTLRKGWREGLLITIAACVPAIAGLFISDVGITMVVATLSVFVVCHASAVFLRALMSWPVMLIANLVISLLFGLIIGFNEVQVKAELKAFLANAEFQPGSGVDREMVLSWIEGFTRGQIVGAATFFQQMASLPALVLSRWMQASLYNPGGFKQEFTTQRWHPAPALLLLAGYVLSWSLGEDYIVWVVVFAVPLTVVALGLSHYVMAKLGLGVFGIWAFYIAFLVFRPISTMVLVLLSVADALLDLRQRIQFKRD